METNLQRYDYEISTKSSLYFVESKSSFVIRLHHFKLFERYKHSDDQEICPYFFSPKCTGTYHKNNE